MVLVGDYPAAIAFAKAHRHFRQLRDPERFRSWLVRMVWRMAHDMLDTGRAENQRQVERRQEHRVAGFWSSMIAFAIRELNKSPSIGMPRQLRPALMSLPSMRKRSPSMEITVCVSDMALHSSCVCPEYSAL